MDYSKFVNVILVSYFNLALLNYCDELSIVEDLNVLPCYVL